MSTGPKSPLGWIEFQRSHMVVAPIVKGEFEKLVEKYIDNLIKRFGGEV